MRHEGWDGFIWVTIERPMAGSCEHCNEQPRSIKGAILFHGLSDSAPFRILEVPGSNINKESGYAEVFLVFPQSL
jgi:hypothetical protein